MISLRKSSDRGRADHGWLRSQHSFSFADYYDPAHNGWGNLLVINEDQVAPGQGFGTHGHRDMEIISYVLEGELAHRDSMGNGTAIRPGEVQRMSAGTGVRHSEFNHSQTGTVHFLQIWILPAQQGIAPGYEQKAFADTDKRGRLCKVASPDGAEGSVTIHADATLYAGLLDGEEAITQPLDPARKGYLFTVRGKLVANGQPLSAGDALRVEGEHTLRLEAGEGAEVLWFDLAP
ncbi:pirin family protein [Uliginosibacterium paludis]|uniref:Pirin family protein n=1 Tax=Uliginosibacterium paludis TaxID=1615952 RepID=A0ABV2CST5_9RHOO